MAEPPDPLSHPSSHPSPERDGAKRRKVAAILALVVVAMVGVAYASVPLYRAFCAATGFNGQARRVERASFTPIARQITVRFDTNVKDLPWDFAPAAPTAQAQLGKAGLAYFKVKNRSNAPLRGRAAYNVFPEAAAAYFIKTQCFCFSDQTIGAGEEVTFPVIFYVDPKFDKDSSTANLSEILLSYTFFPVPPAKAAEGATTAKTSAR